MICYIDLVIKQLSKKWYKNFLSILILMFKLIKILQKCHQTFLTKLIKCQKNSYYPLITFTKMSMKFCLMLILKYLMIQLTMCKWKTCMMHIILILDKTFREEKIKKSLNNNLSNTFFVKISELNTPKLIKQMRIFMLG